jgi:hypothetical protein
MQCEREILYNTVIEQTPEETAILTAKHAEEPDRAKTNLGDR